MIPVFIPGGVTERPKVTVLKTVVAQATVGSNPTPSASLRQGFGWQASGQGSDDISKIQIPNFKTPFPHLDKA